jgi:quinol monooxygenase YgiN
MSNVGVVAIFKSTTEGADQLADLLKGIVPTSQAEDGVLRYSLQRAAKDPTTFVMVEKYVDRDAFKAHAGAPHMAEFMGAIKDLLAEAPQLIITDFVDVGDPDKA